MDILEHELCAGIAAYYGVPEERISLAAGRKELLAAMLGGDGRFITSETDDISSYVAPERVVCVPNLSDMRIDVDALLDTAAGDDTVMLTNPCLPTSLLTAEDDIARIAAGVNVVVDETYALSRGQSAMRFAAESSRVSVMIELPFCGNICFAVGKRTVRAGDISPEKLAAAGVVFSHPAAVRGAEKKLSDSAESLYIRIKKLAIKYESVERLYRSRASFVFFAVKNAGERAEELEELGFKVRSDDGHLCTFAGTSEENNAFIPALQKVLERIL